MTMVPLRVRLLRAATNGVLTGQRRPDGLVVQEGTIANVTVRHYRPTAGALARMLYCHGGGFISGSLDGPIQMV